MSKPMPSLKPIKLTKVLGKWHEDGLTAANLLALSLIYENPKLTVSALAKRMAIKPTTMHNHVYRLLDFKMVRMSNERPRSVKCTSYGELVCEAFTPKALVNAIREAALLLKEVDSHKANKWLDKCRAIITR